MHFLIVAAALPWIAEQSYVATLKHFGSEDLAAAVANEEIARRWLAISVTVVLASASIVSGVLLLKRRPAGGTLWLIVCAAFVLFSLVDVALSGITTAAVLRLALWGSGLLVSYPILRKQGGTWFTPRS